MSLSNYPPLLEGKLPAFVVDDTGTTKMNIPYTLNKAVSLNDFTQMSLMLKTVTTGNVKLRINTGSCKMQNEKSKQRYATFMFANDANDGDNSEETFTPRAGNFYKAQIAFKGIKENGTEIISPWSSVGVIKCTYAPSVSISSLKPGIDNINPSIFVGTYINKDVTEKLYAYTFTIYDADNKVYETSGKLIHNGSTDEVIKDIGIKSTIQWKPYKTISDRKRFRIALEVETVNGYVKSTAPYYIKSAATVDADIPARLLATPDYDNGRIKLSLIKKEGLAAEVPFTGNFVITRYSENLNSWNEVCRFNMLSQTPSDVGVLWTDHTIEHGVRYLYALQAYNSNQLYSNKMYHVLMNPDIYNSSKPYLDVDEFGEPYYITADFEDMFLTDGERQLKVRFDPKVSSYKPTILESKVETMGSQYPFIFRNGSVNYKEFSVQGLLSYLTDEEELFMNGVKPPEDTMKRSRSVAATHGFNARKDWLAAADAGTKLTSDNFYRERQFKMEALAWLTNGEPKLFRSPAEGNCIVRLMNVSLSPNETLGRMLHTFSATAYEIDKCNFENLNKYELLYLPEVDNRAMKFAEVTLKTASTDNVYSISGEGMYHVYITNAAPGTVYDLAFNDLTEDSVVRYTIGVTGALYLDKDAYPVSSVTLISGDDNGTAKLHYGYYDTSIPDNFSYISNVITKDEAVQVIGYDDSKNIITDKLEDIRRQVGYFYNITIKPRPIYTVYYYDNKYYEDSLKQTEYNGLWSDVGIYYVYNLGKYYGGNPANNVYLGNKLPDQYFKLNGTYILDLSTGNAYKSTDELKNVLSHNPQAGQYFEMITHGIYQVSTDFENIQSIHLSTGVYVELAYELREVEYTVETTDDTVAEQKEKWLVALNAYNDPENTDTELDDVINAYATFIDALEDALETSRTESGYHAL